MSVLVCRGCCCGTARKHPTVDHAAQLGLGRELPIGIRLAPGFTSAVTFHPPPGLDIPTKHVLVCR